MEVVHIFKDEFDKSNPIQCVANIRVEEKRSGGSDVFQIFIEYIFKNIKTNEHFTLEPDKIISPHPFSQCMPQEKELAGGDIIIKNSMTKEMVKYMMMNDAELEKFSGRNTPQTYRTHIIQALVKMWD
tara:strand:+ start:436 stop:819 length:384 start_codon:yes stop_codon:yes gene_type:complete